MNANLSNQVAGFEAIRKITMTGPGKQEMTVGATGASCPTFDEANTISTQRRIRNSMALKGQCTLPRLLRAGANIPYVTPS